MEDPNVIARGTWAHFKPYFVILGVLLAVVGPAWFIHGPGFWLALVGWWAFLALAAVVAYQVWARRQPSNNRREH